MLAIGSATGKRRQSPLAVCAVSLVLGLVLLGSFAVDSADPRAGGSCDRFAAPGAHGSGDGSFASPYHSPQRLVNSLRRGETGCFRRGAYEFSTLTIEKQNVSLAPFRGERVALRGSIKVLPSASDTVIRGMRLRADDIGPRVYADRVTLRGNEITNGNSETCILVTSYYDHPAPTGTVISQNRIHHCGRLPATNHDHGIYLSEARGTVVRDNRITDNADRGIQLYPDAQGSTITGNAIRRNGQGLVFSGDGGRSSNDNLVTGNVIADSRIGWNVYSGEQGPKATGNRLRGNCVHSSAENERFKPNGGVQTPSRNFIAFNNVVRPPRAC